MRKTDDIEARRCRALWAAVLRQAIREWLWAVSDGSWVNGLPKLKGGKESAKNDLERFFFRDCETFEFICEALDLDVDEVRKKVKSWDNQKQNK